MLQYLKNLNYPVISVYSLSTEEKKRNVTIYKRLLGMSYLKTRNSIYNKLLPRTYLQTLFSIYDQQFLFFLKKEKSSSV